MAQCSHPALAAASPQSYALVEVRLNVQGTEPTAAEASQLSRIQGDQVDIKDSVNCSDDVGMLSITTTFVTLDLELLCSIIARATK